MKTQIRRGVFETNSSSVHSISIIKDDFKSSLPIQFTIDCDGMFGWEVYTYDSPENKAAYLYQAIVSYPTYNEHNKEWYDAKIAKEKLQDLMDKFISNLESYGIEIKCKYKFAKIFHTEYFASFNLKKYNYDYVLFVDENGNTSKNIGFLDHGSEAKEFVDYVLSSPENTVKFIFDYRCFIETGNDNDSDYWDREKHINEEFIIFEKGN